MGCSKEERGIEAESLTSSLSSLIVGGAIYSSGEDWWEGGGKRVEDGNRTRSSACPDSKVKGVIVSCSFSASPVKPVNPIS